MLRSRYCISPQQQQTALKPSHHVVKLALNWNRLTCNGLGNSTQPDHHGRGYNIDPVATQVTNVMLTLGLKSRQKSLKVGYQ